MAKILSFQKRRKGKPLDVMTHDELMLEVIMLSKLISGGEISIFCFGKTWKAAFGVVKELRNGMISEDGYAVEDPRIVSSDTYIGVLTKLIERFYNHGSLR